MRRRRVRPDRIALRPAIHNDFDYTVFGDDAMTKPTRKGVTLELLELFRQVAVLGSITAAGREAGITASLATRRIALLERALDVRLFQRTTRKIRLTEAGERTLEWATEAIDSFAEMQNDLTSLTQKPRGLIRLAINHYAANNYLPAILTRFCDRYPEIVLRITTTDALVNLIDEGFDLAVHSGRIPDSSLVGVCLRDVRRVLCAAPDYIKKRGLPQSLSDLDGHACLVHSSHEPANWFFRRGDQIFSHSVYARVEVDSHSLLLELARNGLGIARIGYNIAKPEFDKGRLVQVLPDFDCVHDTGDHPGLWLLYPNRKLPYRIRLLADFLIENLTPRGSIG